MKVHHMQVNQFIHKLLYFQEYYIIIKMVYSLINSYDGSLRCCKQIERIKSQCYTY